MSLLSSAVHAASRPGCEIWLTMLLCMLPCRLHTDVIHDIALEVHRGVQTGVVSSRCRQAPAAIPACGSWCVQAIACLAVPPALMPPLLLLCTETRQGPLASTAWSAG